MWKIILIATCALFAVSDAETAAGYKKKLGLHSLRFTDYNYFNALDKEFVNSPSFKHAYRVFSPVLFEKILVLVIAINNQMKKDPTLTHKDLMVPFEDLDTDNNSACIIKLKDEDACAEDNERRRLRLAAKHAAREAANQAANQTPPVALENNSQTFCVISENPAIENFISRFSSNSHDKSGDQTCKL